MLNMCPDQGWAKPENVCSSSGKFRMEFLMDFEKTSISTKVTKFLQENLKDKKDKESLQNIITEKGLLKNDAINLLITILQALTIPDSTDEETFHFSVSH